MNELLAVDLGSICLLVSLPLVIATWRVEQFYKAKLDVLELNVYWLFSFFQSNLLRSIRY